MPNAIYVKNLSFKYKNNHYYSLSDISLTIKANKCTGIIGPNGAGKSKTTKVYGGSAIEQSDTLIEQSVKGQSVIYE